MPWKLSYIRSMLIYCQTSKTTSTFLLHKETNTYRTVMVTDRCNCHSVLLFMYQSLIVQDLWIIYLHKNLTTKWHRNGNLILSEILYDLLLVWNVFHYDSAHHVILSAWLRRSALKSEFRTSLSTTDPIFWTKNRVWWLYQVIYSVCKIGLNCTYIW